MVRQEFQRRPNISALEKFETNVLNALMYVLGDFGVPIARYSGPMIRSSRGGALSHGVEKATASVPRAGSISREFVVNHIKTRLYG